MGLLTLTTLILTRPIIMQGNRSNLYAFVLSVLRRRPILSRVSMLTMLSRVGDLPFAVVTTQKKPVNSVDHSCSEKYMSRERRVAVAIKVVNFHGGWRLQKSMAAFGAINLH